MSLNIANVEVVGLEEDSQANQPLIWRLQGAEKSQRVMIYKYNHRRRADIHTEMLQGENQRQSLFLYHRINQLTVPLSSI